MSRPIRERLADTLRTNADFDAFCLDCFRPAYDRFTTGMDRVEKTNLLLALVDGSEVGRRLDEWAPRHVPMAASGSAPEAGPKPPGPPSSGPAASSKAAAAYPPPLEMSIEHFKRACARLQAGAAQGTGYLVRPDRLVTCAHVVRGVGLGGVVQARLHDSTADLTATIERIDEAADFAVLRLGTPVQDRPCLPIAAHASAEARWLAFGFPASTGTQGIALGGVVRDPQGRDARGVAAVQLFSEEAAAARGALLAGASGSPVLSGGAVIGHLRRVLPDDEGRAQMGLIFACPVRAFAEALPHAAAQPSFRARTPQSEYDPLWYVPRRDAELLALNKLRDPGGPVTLQAPEGYGKTWMVGHLLERIRQQDLASGRRSEIVRFNLRKEAGDSTASLDALLTTLLRSVLEQLGIDRIDSMLARIAKLPGDAKRRFRRALEQHVLSRAAERIILIVEEGDHLHGSPVETDFFALLRSMAEDGTTAYQRLRIVVTIGAEAGFLETTNHSAFFGLSTPIVLDGFSLPQLRSEASLYGLSPDDPGVPALQRLTGGHPLYSRLAMYEAVCGEQSLAQALERIDARGGLFASNLQRLRVYIEREGLKPALCSILQSPRYSLPMDQYLKLYRKGLVVEQSPGEYRLRCPLFEDYFRALCRS